jgi:hypothetical protein
MKIRTLFASTIALTLMGSTIVPQQAQADIPMEVSSDEGYYFISSPASDTTLPAYGGRLRLYDVHIAKMFEMSHFDCQSANYKSDYTFRWRYLAGSNSNKTNMGEFHISCKLAGNIAAAYGLGKPEYTPTSGRLQMVPTLKITGAKVDKWMRFTASFKPVR